MKQQRLRSALPLILALLPPIFIGWAVFVFAVDTPLWDEWLVGGYLDKFSQGTLSLSDLFSQQNEYRQFFPNLIFVGLGWLTSWDVRSWMATSLVAACVVSVCIYRLGKWSLCETPGLSGWTWFIANFLIFSPVQHENWLQGQQLVYFLPIACLVASLLIASQERLPAGLRFVLAATLSIIASFSSVNGMLCWVLLLPVLVCSGSRTELQRKKWWILFWLAAFAGTVALYFRNYERPVQHDPTGLLHTNIAESLTYYLATLGRSLSPGRMVMAATVGLVLLMLFGWFAIRFVNSIRSSPAQALRQLTWLMLGAYSVLTTALLAVGRLEHDATRSLAPSRYTTFTIYLPVTLVYLASMYLGRKKQPFRILGATVSAARVLSFAAAILVVMHLAIYALGIRQMSSFRALSLYAKGCSLFVNVVEDECLTDAVYPRLEVLKRKINPADRLGFIRPGLMKSNQVLDIAGPQPASAANVGAFETFIQGKDGNYVASGWSILPGREEPADVVLLAYAESDNSPIIFAIAATNPERDYVSALVGRSMNRQTRWTKSFAPSKIGQKQAEVSAWAFDALSGKAYKLESVHDFQNLSGSPRINAHDSVPR